MWKAVLGRDDRSEATSSSKRKDESRSQGDTRSKKSEAAKEGKTRRDRKDSEYTADTTTRGTTRGDERGIDPVSADPEYQMAQSDRIRNSGPADDTRAMSIVEIQPRSREKEDEKKTRRRDRSTSRERRSHRRDRSRSEERAKNDKKEKKLKRRSTDTGAFTTESSRAIGDSEPGRPRISNHVPDMFPGQFTSEVTAPYRPPLSITEGGPGLAADYYNPGVSFGQQQPQRPSTAVSGSTAPSNRPPISTNTMSTAVGAAAAGAAAGYVLSNVSGHSSSYQGQSTSYQGQSSSYQAHSTSYQGQPAGPSRPVNGPSTGIGTSRPTQQSATSSSVPYAVAAGVAGGIAAGALHSHTHHHSNPYNGAANYPNGSNLGAAARLRSPGPLDKIVNFFKDPDGVARYEEYSEIVGICRDCFEPGSSPYQAPRRHGYRHQRSNEQLRRTRVEKDSRYHSSSDEGKRRSKKAMIGAAAAGIGLGAVGRTLQGDFDDTYSVKSGRRVSSSQVPQASSSSYRRESSDIRNEARSSKGKKVEYSVASTGSTYRDSERTKNGKTEKIVVEQHSSRSRSRDGKKLIDAAAGATIGMAAAAALKRRDPSTEAIRVRYRSRSGSRERRPTRRESPPQQSSIFGNFFSSPSGNGRRKKKSRGFFAFSNGSSSSDSSLAFGASDKDNRRKARRSSPRIKTAAEANAALIGLGTAAAALAAHESRGRRSSKHVPAVVAVKTKGKQDRHDAQKRRMAAEDGWESASEESDTSVESALAFGSPFNRSRESLTAAGTEKWDWRWGQKKRRGSSPRPEPPHQSSAFASAAASGLAGAAIGALAGEAMSSKPSRYAEEKSSSGYPLRYVEPVSTSDPRRFEVASHDPVTGQQSYRSRPEPVPIQQPQPMVPVPGAVYAATVPDPSISFSRDHRDRSKRDAHDVVVIQPKLPRSMEEEEHYRREERRGERNSDRIIEVEDSRGGKRSQAQVVRSSELRDVEKHAKPTTIVIEPGKRRDPIDNREIHHSELDDDHLAELHKELERLKATAKPRFQQNKPAGSLAGIGMAGIAAAAVTAAAAVAVEKSHRGETSAATDIPRSSKDAGNRDTAGVSAKIGGFADIVNRATKVKEDDSPVQDQTSEVDEKARERPRERVTSTTRIERSQSPAQHESYAAYFAPDDILSRPSKAKETNPDPNADVNIADLGDGRARSARGRYAEPEYPKIENEEFDPPEAHQLLPWPVPRLGLINPTPIPSRSPSAQPSPIIQAVETPASDTGKGSRKDTEPEDTQPEPKIIAPKETSAKTNVVVEEPKAAEEVIAPKEEDPSAEIESPVEEIKRTSMPGGFDDDIDFAATLAAGAAAAGFDPDIVIEDPTYRRRDSPPGSQTRPFYQQPYYQTVSDIGVPDPYYSSTFQQHGFVEGEVPDTPKEEKAPPAEDNKKAAKASRKEQRKKGKGRRRQDDDDDVDVANDDGGISNTAGPLEDEDVPNSTELEIIEDMARDTQTEPDTPTTKKSKKKSKGSSSAGFASVALAALGGAAAAKTIEDRDTEEPKSAKKKSKKSNGFDFASIAMAAAGDSSKAKTEEARSPSVEDLGEEFPPKDVRKPVQRETSGDEIDSVIVPKTTGQARSVEAQGEENVEAEEEFNSSNEYAQSVTTYAGEDKSDEEDSRKKKRKSKRRSKTFDDAPITSLSQSKVEDSQPSKKKGGIFGIFGRSSTNESNDKQASNEAQEDDFEPVEASKKKKKSRKSRDFDDAASVASAPATETGRDVEDDDDRKSRRRRSRKGTRDGDDSGRTTQILPDKNDYNIARQSENESEDQSFLGERREKLKPPDSDIEQEQYRDESDPGTLPQSVPQTPIQRPSTPPKIDWIKDDAFTPKASDSLPSQFSLAQSSAVYSPATPSPTAVPLIFRKPPSSAAGARSSPTGSSPALTTPRSRKSRPQSKEFRSNEFRPLWLVSQYGPKEELDPEEVFPSLPSSHSNSRSSSIHEDEMENVTGASKKFSGKAIDIAKASEASQDILDSTEVTPTAASHRSKREQDLLDEARHEAVARELEWVQKTSPESKRRSQEYAASTPASSTRETVQNIGIPVAAGLAAAVGLYEAYKPGKEQGTFYDDRDSEMKSTDPSFETYDSTTRAFPSLGDNVDRANYEHYHEEEAEHKIRDREADTTTVPTKIETVHSPLDVHVPMNKMLDMTSSRPEETVMPTTEKATVTTPTYSFTPRVREFDSDHREGGAAAVVTPFSLSVEEAASVREADSPAREEDIHESEKKMTIPIAHELSKDGDETSFEKLSLISAESREPRRETVREALPSLSASEIPNEDHAWTNTFEHIDNNDLGAGTSHQDFVDESELFPGDEITTHSDRRLAETTGDGAEDQQEPQLSEVEARSANDSSSTRSKPSSTRSLPTADDTLMAASLNGAVAISVLRAAEQDNDLEPATRQDPPASDEPEFAWTSKKSKKKNKKKKGSVWSDEPLEIEPSASKEILESQKSQDSPAPDTPRTKRKSVTFLDNPVSQEHYITVRDQDLSPDEAKSLLVEPESNSNQLVDDIPAFKDADAALEEPASRDAAADEILQSIDLAEPISTTNNDEEQEVPIGESMEPQTVADTDTQFTDRASERPTEYTLPEKESFTIGQLGIPSQESSEERAAEQQPASVEVSDFDQPVTISDHDAGISRSLDDTSEPEPTEHNAKEPEEESAAPEDSQTSTQEPLPDDDEPEYSYRATKKPKKGKGKKSRPEESQSAPIIPPVTVQEEAQDADVAVPTDDPMDEGETAEPFYTIDSSSAKNKKRKKKLLKQQQLQTFQDELEPDAADDIAMLSSAQPKAPLEESDAITIEPAIIPDTPEAPIDTEPAEDLSFSTKSQKQKKKKRQSYGWLEDEPATEAAARSEVLDDKNDMLVDEGTAPLEREIQQSTEVVRGEEGFPTREISMSGDGQEDPVVSKGEFQSLDGPSTVSPTFDESLASGLPREDTAADDAFVDFGKKKKKGKKKNRVLSWTDTSQLDEPIEESTANDVVSAAPEEKPLSNDDLENVSEAKQNTIIEPDLASDRVVNENDTTSAFPVENPRADEEAYHFREEDNPLQSTEPEADVFEHSRTRHADTEHDIPAVSSFQEHEAGIDHPAADPQFEIPRDKSYPSPLVDKESDDIRQEPDAMVIDDDKLSKATPEAAISASTGIESDTSRGKPALVGDSFLDIPQDVAEGKTTKDTSALEDPIATDTVPEEDWGLTSKASKKDKKKKKKQALQSSMWDDDKVEFEATTLEEAAENNDSVDLATKDQSLGSSNLATPAMPIDQNDAATKEESGRSLSREPELAADDDNIWASSSKKSKKGKKGRKSLSWESEETAVVANSLAATVDEDQAITDTQPSQDILDVENKDSFTPLDKDLQTKSPPNEQDEFQRGSRKKGKGKKAKKFSSFPVEDEDPAPVKAVDKEITVPISESPDIATEQASVEEESRSNQVVSSKHDSADVLDDKHLARDLLAGAAVAVPIAIASGRADRELSPTGRAVSPGQRDVVPETKANFEDNETIQYPDSALEDLDAPESGPQSSSMALLKATQRSPVQSAENNISNTLEESEDRSASTSSLQQSSKSRKKSKKNKKAWTWEPEPETEEPLETSIDDTPESKDQHRNDESEMAANSLSSEIEHQPGTSPPQKTAPENREMPSDPIFEDNQKETPQYGLNASDKDAKAELFNDGLTSGSPTLASPHSETQGISGRREDDTFDGMDIQESSPQLRSNLEISDSRSAGEARENAAEVNTNLEQDLERPRSREFDRDEKHLYDSEMDLDRPPDPDLAPISAVTQSPLQANIDSEGAFGEYYPSTEHELDHQINDQPEEDYFNRSIVQEPIEPSLREDNSNLTRTDELVSDTEPRFEERDASPISTTAVSQNVARDVVSDPYEHESQTVPESVDDKKTSTSMETIEAILPTDTTANQDATLTDDPFTWSSSKKGKKGKKKRQTAAKEAEFAFSEQPDDGISRGFEDDKIVPSGREPVLEAHSDTSAKQIMDDLVPDTTAFADISRAEPILENRDIYNREPLTADPEASQNQEVQPVVEDDDFEGWASTKKSKKGKKGKKGKKEVKSFDGDEESAPLSRAATENIADANPFEESFAKANPLVSTSTYEYEQNKYPSHDETTRETEKAELARFEPQEAQVEERRMSDIEPDSSRQISYPKEEDQFVSGQTSDYQPYAAVQEEQDAAQSSDFWEKPSKKKGKKGKNKAIIATMAEEDVPEDDNEVLITDSGKRIPGISQERGYEDSKESERRFDVLESDFPANTKMMDDRSYDEIPHNRSMDDQLFDDYSNTQRFDRFALVKESEDNRSSRKTSSFADVFDSEPRSELPLTVFRSRSPEDKARSSSEAPADNESHTETARYTNDKEVFSKKNSNSPFEQHTQRDDIEDDEPTFKGKKISRFDTRNTPQEDSHSISRAVKTASKVGAGIALFEGTRRTASMSEERKSKKNRSLNQERRETPPAVFDEQEHPWLEHRHTESSHTQEYPSLEHRHTEPRGTQDHSSPVHKHAGPSTAQPVFRDSALHMDSPIPTSNRESIRDSGFQDDNHGTLNVSVEVDPQYDVKISSPTNVHRSMEHIDEGFETSHHTNSNQTSHHERSGESPLLAHTSIQNSSTGILSPQPSEHHRSVHNEQTHRDISSVSPAPQIKSIFGGQIGHSSDRDLDSFRSPPMTPTSYPITNQPLTTIAEASPDDGKHLTSSELEHKRVRRSGIRRQRSPNPENPRHLGLISTEDLISRQSWPEFDEEGHLVKSTGQSRTTERQLSAEPKARPLSNIETSQTHDRRSTSGNSVESNDSINAYIRSPPPTSTPPLRRSGRSLSGDLRLSNRRQDENNANPDLAKENKRQLNFEAESEGLASSSTYDPLKDKGKSRSAAMADVYEGYGDLGGSPRSPTRPNSIRRRQSLQILDLETRLDQLVSENRLLLDAKNRAERNLEQSMQDSDQQNQAHRDAIVTRDQYLQQKDEELASLRATLQELQAEIAKLSDANRSINGSEPEDWRQHYDDLMVDHTTAREQLDEQSAELEELRNKHTSLSGGMEAIVANEVSLALQSKDAELEQIRQELIAAKDQVRQLQREILAVRRQDTDSVDRDEDYFDARCEDLCKQVQQFILRYSKFSDMRICRRMAEVQDEKITDRFDIAVLDGTDVDVYLADRIKRRDVFMSVTMSLMWEYIFTRYLFGMDREQRQKLKYLEKTLSEVGPPAAVNKWRAMTLSLLSKREAFQAQRQQDTDAVVSEILRTLGAFLPPPANLRDQIAESLRKVVSFAVDLSVEMRTQKAEYIMLPPIQPEYNLQGDLETMVYFNAASMNERSGTYTDNKALEEQEAVVRIVLFPLVIKQGDGEGKTNEQEVICPAQVLIAKDEPEDNNAGRKSARAVSVQANRSVQSFAPSNVEGGMI